VHKLDSTGPATSVWRLVAPPANARSTMRELSRSLGLKTFQVSISVSSVL
jgi:hypothetical protein